MTSGGVSGLNEHEMTSSASMSERPNSLIGRLRRATAKTIRHRLLDIARRVSPRRRRLHLDRTWPWTATLLDAIHRLRHAFRSPTVTGGNPKAWRATRPSAHVLKRLTCAAIQTQWSTPRGPQRVSTVSVN